MTAQEFFYINDHNSNGHADLILFEFSNHKIICGYKSPGIKTQVLENMLESLFSKIKENDNVIVIGNYNLDVYNKNNINFINFMSQHNLESRLNSTIATTSNNTQIDILFSNSNILCGVYDTYFSDHKPIFAILLE